MNAELEVAELVQAAQSEFGRIATEHVPEQLAAEKLSADAWRGSVRALPTAVLTLLRTIDLTTLRMQALETIEAELFGWDARHDAGRALDNATVGSLWRRSLSAARRAETLRTIRRVVDQTKLVAQILKLQAHDCASALPDWQEEPEVQEGVLHVRDVHRGAATFGVRSYPEATPVEVVVYVVRRWIDTTHRAKPRCWDLTGGSGTVKDVVTTVFGGHVIGTDIALDNASTVYGDLRDAGRHSRHQRARKRFAGDQVPTGVIARPDLVFIHPPSRGWPACSWVYGRDVVATSRDLGLLLERDQYVRVVADAVRAGLAHMADGGLVSVLIPEYVRLHQQLTADFGTADLLLEKIADVSTLIERHAVVDDAPVRQASLGTSRGPLEHLILTRKSSS